MGGFILEGIILAGMGILKLIKLTIRFLDHIVVYILSFMLVSMFFMYVVKETKFIYIALILAILPAFLYDKLIKHIFLKHLEGSKIFIIYNFLVSFIASLFLIYLAMKNNFILSPDTKFITELISIILVTGVIYILRYSMLDEASLNS